MAFDKLAARLIFLLLFVFAACNKQDNRETVKASKERREVMSLKDTTINCKHLNIYIETYLVNHSTDIINEIHSYLKKNEWKCDSSLIEEFYKRFWSLEGEGFNIESFHIYLLYSSFFDVFQGVYLENAYVLVGYNSYKYPVFFANWLDTCSTIQKEPISAFVNEFGVLFDSNDRISTRKWQANLQKRKDVFSKPEFSKYPKIKGYLKEIDKKLIVTEQELKYLDSLEAQAQEQD